MTSSTRIAQAVDNEGWQKFRVSLKGLPTAEKLDRLHIYWSDVYDHEELHQDCDVCIRVDNYIKALCRGGQLISGMSLAEAIERNWALPIKRSI